jgi:hypothetical protein
MTRQEYDRLTLQPAGEKLVRGRAEGRLDAPPLGVFQTLDPIDAAAA